jgi:hypothetical protein
MDDQIPVIIVNMSCGTAVCAKVYAVVEKWINAHPEVEGIWDVSDGSRTFDVFITVGTRRLTFQRLQFEGNAPLTPEIENQILNWLANLSDQPTLTTIPQS